MSVEAVKEEHETEEDIHLFIESTEANDSVVAVRWCICKSVFEQVKRYKEIADPYLLLIVTHNKTEVERRLVPLDQMMEYIWLQRPGSHMIFATVILRYNRKHENLRIRRNFNEIFLEKNPYDRNAYLCSLIYFEGDNLFGRVDFYNNFYCKRIGEAIVEVVVPEGFFAKKPPQWLYDWANYWYETLPRDQCQFRRRCMLAFTVQPPVLLVWASVVCIFRLLIILILVLFGMRKIRFRSVLHPLTKEICYDFTEKGTGSVFIRNKEGELRPLFLAPFTPVIFLFFFVMSYILGQAGLVPLKGLWGSALAAACIVVATSMLFVLLKPISFGLELFFAALAKIFSKRIRKIKGWRNVRHTNRYDRRKAKEEEISSARIKELEERFSPIICTGTSVEPKYKAIPQSHRTIYLWYRYTKAKVCKPFAR